jgi:hypothetical protein
MRYITLLVIILPVAVGCDDMRSASAPASATQSVGETTEPRESIDNPQYRYWASFAKGTSVIHRSVTRVESTEGETVTTTTYVLAGLTPEEAVVEMKTATRRYDGFETNNPPSKFTYPKRLLLPPGHRAAESKDQGEEVVRLGGKDFHTKWQKSKDRDEAGEVFVQVWSSPEVPGGLVKSVLRTPAIGKTTTTELVEVRLP